MEKSTALCPGSPSPSSAGPTPACCEIAPGLILDGRLALVHRDEGWLAAADLHYGYETARRRAGALWPLWGMESVADRLHALLEDHRPEVLILVGDVVDGSSAPDEAVTWLASVRGRVPRLVLVEGNHDRGPVKDRFDWVPSFRLGENLFEHGHLPSRAPDGIVTRISGHLHPSVSLRDGAGTTLRLPALVEREMGDKTRQLILPAFSPWAGGSRLEPCDREVRTRRWACSPQRAFEVVD